MKKRLSLITQFVFILMMAILLLSSPNGWMAVLFIIYLITMVLALKRQFSFGNIIRSKR